MTGVTHLTVRMLNLHTRIFARRLMPRVGRLCSASANGVRISRGCGARKLAEICGAAQEIFKIAGAVRKNGRMGAVARMVCLRSSIRKLDYSPTRVRDTGMILTCWKLAMAA